MASESLHEDRGILGPEILNRHRAIATLMEELEAIDWYRQRADDCEDADLKAILLHNMREEMEHASMVLEWIRRNDKDFAKELEENLFKDGAIAGRHG